jgi:hypothetical protein
MEEGRPIFQSEWSCPFPKGRISGLQDIPSLRDPVFRGLLVFVYQSPDVLPNHETWAAAPKRPRYGFEKMGGATQSHSLRS